MFGWERRTRGAVLPVVSNRTDVFSCREECVYVGDTEPNCILSLLQMNQICIKVIRFLFSISLSFLMVSLLSHTVEKKYVNL